MFTPVESSIGALLIQSATTSYLLSTGKIIGFSSLIYNSIFHPTIHTTALISGIVLSVWFVQNYLPDFVPEYAAVANISFFHDKFHFFPSPSSTSSTSSLLSFNDITTPLFELHLLAGLLVGFGTSWGCGCTSGHMLAGFSRLRLRSIVATCVFVSTAILTVIKVDSSSLCYLADDGVGESDTVNANGAVANVIVRAAPVECYKYDSSFTVFKENATVLLCLVGYALFSLLTSLILIKNQYVNSAITNKLKNNQFLQFLAGVNGGFLFGLGLFITGLARPAKTLGFLSMFVDFPTFVKFDPSLLMVIVFAIIPNILVWRVTIPQKPDELVMSDGKPKKQPILQQSFSLNFSNAILVKFLLGNALFGIGWGLLGVCPGPGVLAVFFNGTNGVVWLLAFLAGYFAARRV